MCETVRETVSAGNKRTSVANQPANEQAKTIQDPLMASQMGHFELLAAKSVDFYITNLK